MSVTSSTEKTSKSSALMSIFSCFSAPSSPSSSAFFFARAAFFLAAGSLNSCCFFLHWLRSFVHSDHLPLNHSDGWRSSTRSVSFFASTQSRRYSLHFSSSCHGKATSSKPSSAAGSVNLEKESAMSFGLRSGASFLRKVSFFSSSVSDTSSTGTSISASSASSASFSSAFSGSSAGSSPAALFSLASLARLAASIRAFFAASAFFFRSSSCFFRISSTFFRFASASAFALLTSRTWSCTQLRNSAGGSPIITLAVRLKSEVGNLATIALRSSANRFPLTCITTKFRCSAGAAVMRTRLALRSSSNGRPKPMSGLSLLDLQA
mmetsp:Transcript_128211/g.356805  ORF Transcript_128211/g.356805 Transcript_128211/m.356805 type:complete len:322 (-) Transcript_128211:1015-1980(-)